jgi:hypothetical protein
MKFDEWFRKQFGSIAEKKIEELYKRREDLEKDIIHLNYRIHNRLEYDSMYKAARYAWNLKDKDKK